MDWHGLMMGGQRNRDVAPIGELDLRKKSDKKLEMGFVLDIVLAGTPALSAKTKRQITIYIPWGTGNAAWV
jgi:hypothetical protein